MNKIMRRIASNSLAAYKNKWKKTGSDDSFAEFEGGFEIYYSIKRTTEDDAAWEQLVQAANDLEMEGSDISVVPLDRFAADMNQEFSNQLKGKKLTATDIHITTFESNDSMDNEISITAIYTPE